MDELVGRKLVLGVACAAKQSCGKEDKNPVTGRLRLVGQGTKRELDILRALLMRIERFYGLQMVINIKGLAHGGTDFHGVLSQAGKFLQSVSKSSFDTLVVLGVAE